MSTKKSRRNYWDGVWRSSKYGQEHNPIMFEINLLAIVHLQFL